EISAACARRVPRYHQTEPGSSTILSPYERGFGRLPERCACCCKWNRFRFHAILPSARDVFQSRRVNCLQPGTAFMIANTASILHLRRARGAISGCFENHVKVVQRVPVNIVFDLSQNPELYCSRESR